MYHDSKEYSLYIWYYIDQRTHRHDDLQVGRTVYLARRHTTLACPSSVTWSSTPLQASRRAVAGLRTGRGVVVATPPAVTPAPAAGPSRRQAQQAYSQPHRATPNMCQPNLACTQTSHLPGWEIRRCGRGHMGGVGRGSLPGRCPHGMYGMLMVVSVS